MGLSDRTTNKLREESEEVGGKIYEDDQDVPEEEITHFDEDDDPLTLIGDLDEDGDVDADDERLKGGNA